MMHAGGPRAVFTEIDKKYWLPRAVGLVRRVVYKCVPCTRRLAKPTRHIMAPSHFYRQPSARLHLFDKTAVNVAGLFYIKVGRSDVKRWILILRCATIGAVHTEMHDFMDTSSFLLAMERFLAFRPRPYLLIADNGTNFRGCNNALKENNGEGCY
jgi:hypothetical protein